MLVVQERTGLNPDAGEDGSLLATDPQFTADEPFDTHAGDKAAGSDHGAHWQALCPDLPQG